MAPNDESEIAEALRWITGILVGCEAEFQAVGGVAARAYGATRPLVDLDFYVPGSDLPRILAAVGEFCVWGPEHYRDDSWDLTFAKLDREGVRIELGKAEGARYYDRFQGRWADQDVDFSSSELRAVLGVELPVMPRAQLVSYKRGLDRGVDRLDLKEIA